ncbi:MAG: redoxin domain-containing protein [Candidatus Omnitrophica bacterium]|nr:redoxin domain-containing protein [Candidatus Omnitrophota bacterium]
MIAGIVAFIGVLVSQSVSAAPPDLFKGPQEGETAPDFLLKDLQGDSVGLKQFKKKQPVVLVTGSYSCPVYRRQAAALKRLYEKYGTRAAFFVLYTVEAHPVKDPSPYAVKEWVTDQNIREQILVRQPTSYAERLALASRCRADLRCPVPVLVDEMDNSVWTRYGSAPNAAYLIDDRGKVQLRQGWFEPIRFEQALLELLQEEPPKW